MKYDPFELTEKLWRLLRQKLTEEEEQEMQEAFRKLPVLKKLAERFRNPEEISDELHVLTSFNVEKALRKVNRKSQRRRRQVLRLWGIRAAATVAIALGAGVWFYIARRPAPVLPLAENRAGGYARVVLKTAAGVTYGLDTLSVAVQLQQDVAFDNRSGVLNVTASQPENADEEPVGKNIVEVPYGGTYTLQLQDGTKVYLNSGSRLEFPSRFIGGQRKVFMSGEAYFEVTRDTTKPFVVEIEQAQIRVLGTAFNVKAYPEETGIYTTLVNGKVSFATGQQTERQLSPGEQLTLDKPDGKIRVEQVDTRLYTAWKDGLFWFKNMPLEEILKSIGRWYNLEIFYVHPEVKTTLFSGKMKMYGAVEDILRKFERSDNISFQLKGRTLTVYRK